MRIGSMFARGSCSALKWAMLFGVVFALGAGSASAQIQAGTSNWKVDEGDYLEVEFKVKTRTATGFAGGTIEFSVHGNGGVVPAGRMSNNPRDGLPTTAEGNADLDPATVTLAVPANSSGSNVDAEATVKASVRIFPDPDAEDEISAVRVQTSATAPTTGILDQAGTQYAANSDSVTVGFVTIDDRQTQTMTWVEGSKTAAKDILEGGSRGSVGITLRAVPAPVNYVWAMTGRTDNNSYPLNEASRGNIQPNPEYRILLDPARSDGDRDDTDVTLTLYHAGTSEKVAEVTPEVFKFKDIHALPADDKITWKAYASKDDGTIDKNTEVTSITEGGPPVHVEVTVERGTSNYPSGEDLQVAVMVAGDGADAMDFRTEDAPLTFEPGTSGDNSRSMAFKLYAQADSDIADEELMLNLVVTGKTTNNGPGEVMAKNPVMLAIEDETMPLLTAVTGEMVEEMVDAARMESAGMDGNNLWTRGEMFSLDGDDLFTSDNAVQVAATSSSGAVGASTQGGMVMLTAMEVGMATITITGTVASSSFTSTQTVDNIATIEFDLEVDELPLEITLSGPEDMNVPEGMQAMVTATANRAVTADTTVTLNLVDGSGSPADYSVEPIMITTGEMTGTTMLMVTEDSMEEPMETLTFEGSFGDKKMTNRVTFNIWDAAVPALPIIAQLLLAAFLAVGGYRRYLRRR